MDTMDSRIVDILKKNARESFVGIAKSLGVTEGTVRNRVRNLIKTGIIKRFTIEYQAPVEGLVILKSSLKNNNELINKLKSFLDNIFEISGEYDIAVIIDANSIGGLNKIVDKIRSLRGVTDTNTAIKLH